MRLMLAPMEGVLDYTLRAWLTQIGDYDRCVTEFVRVNELVLPKRVFHRFCPELLSNEGRTPSGTPVYLQLLGGNSRAMAANARVAERLGAPGIDINFGCPSKTVNRNDGGSALLREPQRVHEIVKAVRDAVSPEIPVTAKIRLGFRDASLLEEIVSGIDAAHATELCIHARTRLDGYKPPAYWQHIERVRAQVRLPLVVNGEIWSPADARQAQQESGCRDVMLGRGGLCFPDLSRAIRAEQAGKAYTPLCWAEILQILVDYAALIAETSPKFAANRIKQWLNYLRRHYPDAEVLFQQLKRLRTLDEIRAGLQAIKPVTDSGCEF